MFRNQKMQQRPSKQIDDNGVLLTIPPKEVGNKEQIQRMNYLLQLASFQTINNAQDTENSLSRLYLTNLDLIQKKTKTLLTPRVKRSICKTCHRILIPTKTMHSYVENNSRDGRHNNKGDVLVLKCCCGKIKRFPIGKDRAYKCHYEKEGNLLDISKVSHR